MSLIFDIAIGLAAVFALLSVMCSALHEFLFGQLGRVRSRVLEQAIKTMCGEALGAKVLNHELVRRLATPPPLWIAAMKRIPLLKHVRWLNPKNPGPTYLPAKTFVDVFLDIFARENKNAGAPGTALQLAGLATAGPGEIAPIPKDLAPALRAMLAEAATPEQVRQRLEEWFDGTMERWTGHFRRYTRAWMIVWAALLVLTLNIDTLKIARYLSYTPSALKALVEAAPQLAQRYPSMLTNGAAATPADSTHLSPAAIARLNHELFRGASSNLFDLDLPIGWAQSPIVSDQKSTEFSVFKKLLGLAISIAAISMGAPFWFDLISRIASLRSSVKPSSPPPAHPAPR